MNINKNYITSVVVILVCLFFSPMASWAQCTPAASTPIASITCPADETYTDANASQNMTSGTNFEITDASTYCCLGFNGGSLYISGASTIRGDANTAGTVVYICGTGVNIGNINYNQPMTFVIMPGASATFTNATTFGNATQITNYGTLSFSNTLTVNSGGLNLVNAAGATLNFANSVTFNNGASLSNYGTLNSTCSGCNFQFNSNSTLINANTTSVMNLGSTNFRLDNGVRFVNNGFVTTSGNAQIQGGAGICLGPGAHLTLGSITQNDQTNSITVSPGGSSACVSWGGSATTNNSLTSNSGLLLCRRPGASAPNNPGSGTIVNPCASCNAILPVKFIYFSSEDIEGRVELKWLSISNSNSPFIVQRSSNGIDFETIAEVPLNSYVNTRNSNQSGGEYVDSDVPSGTVYYRIAQADEYGDLYTSRTAVVYGPSWNTTILFPNPNNGSEMVLTYYGEEDNDALMSVMDITGNSLLSYRLEVTSGTAVNVLAGSESLQPGVYFVSLSTIHGKYSHKVVVQ